MSKTLKVAFLGTNGSCAYNNGKRRRFGTNTLSVAVCAGENTLVFDAGSGICGLSGLQDFQNNRMHLFLSHYHVDHMSGLLFWKDLFNSEKDINIYGLDNTKDSIGIFLKKPFNPVGVDVFSAKLGFNDVKDGDEILIDEITVNCMELSHPGGSLGYRVGYGGKVLCYITDIELANHVNDKKLQEFVDGADLLIADSAFSTGKAIAGWGHSTPEECARLAKAAGVKRLALFHYGFSETDEGICSLEESAMKIFEETFASADGLRVEI